MHTRAGRSGENFAGEDGGPPATHGICAAAGLHDGQPRPIFISVRRLAGALGRTVVLKWGAVAPAFFVAVSSRTARTKAMPDAAPGALAADIDRQVSEMGFELVELDVAGNRARPILRVYIDRP